MTSYPAIDGAVPTPPRRKLLAAAALTPVLAGSLGSALAPTASAAPVGHASPAGPPQRSAADGGGRSEPVRTTEEEWQEVARILRRPGQMNRGFMYRTQFPRHDLRVYSQGVRISPALALGSHTAFVRYDDGSAMIMGDLLIAEDELQDVQDTLSEHAIVPTAIHKHLLSHSPDVWWMHIHGHSAEASELASGLRAVLDRTGTPDSVPAPPDESVDLDTDRIDEVMGMAGWAHSGIYSMAFRRRETVTEGNRVLPPGMGAISAFHFQPLGGGRAALHGDFAMIADEVGEALATARRGGIDLVTLHNHGLAETPRLFFVHLWAVDDAVAIARGLRPALDRTDVVPFD